MVRLVEVRWHARGTAALWEHISLWVIAFSLVRAKKLVSVEGAPSAPLLEEVDCSCVLMALVSMENSFDGAPIEKSSH